MVKRKPYYAPVYDTHDTSTMGLLKFPKVLINDGGGYDYLTGLFTAPVSGTYIFYASGQTISSLTHYVYKRKKSTKTPVRIGYGTTNPSPNFWTTQTTQVMTKLQIGDQIFVDISGTLHGGAASHPRNFFQGYLI